MKSAWSLFKVLFTISLSVILASGVSAGDEFYEKGKEPANQIGTVALTLGTPAGINLTLAGGTGPKWGPYISGMYWDGEDQAVHGIQGGVMKLFKTHPNHFQGWLLSAGYFYIKDCWEIHEFTFGGIGHIWKWKALYTQVDFLIGSGDDAVTQLGLQVGVNLTTVREKRK